MLRSVGVLVVGVLAGFTVQASLGLVVMAINSGQQPRPYIYYLLFALTGSAVGLLVGFLQKYKAGLVAMICLAPQSILQYVNRFSRPATGLRLFLLLLGTALELSFGISCSRPHPSGAATLRGRKSR